MHFSNSELRFRGKNYLRRTDPKEVTPFAAVNDDFLTDYTEIVRVDTSARIAEWLIKNAHRMNKYMFLDHQNDWCELRVEHVLTLRAFAPTGVFNPTVKSSYLDKIDNNLELEELANYIFGDDYQFIAGLSDELKKTMITMVKMAYQAKIRIADERIRRM